MNIRVVPRASRSEIGEPIGERLKIRVQSPPLDGKANKALLRLLADILNCRQKDIVLTAGRTGRDKIILVPNATRNQICKALGVEG